MKVASWDGETITALIGSECLYILRECQALDVSSDENIPLVSPKAADGIRNEREMNKYNNSMSKVLIYNCFCSVMLSCDTSLIYREFEVNMH